MPSLPFTFNDLVSLSPADKMRTAKEADVDPTAANNMKAQNFLVGKLNSLKDSVSSSDGLLDVGLAMNPVTRVADMTSKFFGGPGLVQGFRDGVRQPVGDERSGRSELRIPPLMF
jgi:hypothetical protein